MTTREQNEMKYDVRVVERRLRKGELDPKEYEAFLKRLPNDESRATYIEVYEETPATEEPTPHAEELTFT